LQKSAPLLLWQANNFAPEQQKNNSACFLQGWKESLKEDDKLAFKVCVRLTRL